MAPAWLSAGLAALAIGLATPWLNAGLITLFSRGAPASRRPGMAVGLSAMFISLAACSAGLILTSRQLPGQSPVIVLAFMLGLGAARWWRKEI